MRTFALCVLMALSSAAFGASKVFQNQAEYTKVGWDSRFNELEKAGVERAAERRAYSACVNSGATDCVILEGAYIEACEYLVTLQSVGCKATASARGQVP